jgi:hypothetical protein
MNLKGVMSPLKKGIVGLQLGENLTANLTATPAIIDEQ